MAAKANSSSPAQRQVQVGAPEPNSCQLNPSRDLDAFALPIYEPIFLINTYGQSLWKALFSPHDARYCVQYEAHYLFGDYIICKRCLDFSSSCGPWRPAPLDQLKRRASF